MIADRGMWIVERKERSLRVAETVTSAEDFHQRRFEFGSRVIRLVESLSKTDGAGVIGKQLLRCATTVGANYRVAARARSRADFIAKMALSKKSAMSHFTGLKCLLISD